MKTNVRLILSAFVISLLMLAACVVAPPATSLETQEMAVDSDADMDTSDMSDADMDTSDMADEDTPAEADAPAPQMPPPVMNQLAEGVYHYFGFFASSLVVVSDEGVLITDTGSDMKAQSLKEEIAKITDAPVTTIVMTHEHYDHVGGSGVFEDAQVICHVNCQAVFDLFDNPFGDVPEVDQTFEDYMAINVGDKVVELHYLGPGDGDATTIIYMPEEQIIVTSDMYEPRALTHANWVEDKNFTGTRQILNTISQWPLKHAINAHSLDTGLQDLNENVEYYNDLYEVVYTAIQEALAQGPFFTVYALYDTLPETVHLEKYQDWANYESSFARHVQRMAVSIFHGD